MFWAGRYHSVILGSDGMVYTFGLNDFGQLGRAGLTAVNPQPCWLGYDCRSGTPAPVQGLEGHGKFVAVAAGIVFFFPSSPSSLLVGLT